MNDISTKNYKQKKKLQNDFFVSCIKDQETASNNSDLNKKIRDEKLDSDIVIENNNIKTIDDDIAKLFAANEYQFDNTKLLTKLIINRTNKYENGKELFRDNSKEDHFAVNNCLETEGHYMENFVSNKYNYMKDIPKDAKYVWWCSYEENTIKKHLSTFTGDNDYEKTTMRIQKSLPLTINQFQQILSPSNRLITDEFKRGKMLKITIGSLKFIYHPLFSLENILERYLNILYNEYLKHQEDNKIGKIEHEIQSLRKNKEELKEKLQTPQNRKDRKIYKNSELKKVVHNIKKLRQLRFEKVLEQSNIIDNIISVWKNIKDVRKKVGITNTSIILMIEKKHKNMNNEKLTQDLEMEYEDSIDELKCEYYQKKSTYNTQSPDPEHPIDPNKIKNLKSTLEYDENDIKNKLMEKLSHLLKVSNIIPKVKYSIDIMTKNPTSVNEILRRKDIEKTKIHLKLCVNNKDVCKTNSLLLTNDFFIDINESFEIHLNEDLFLIKILLVEKFFITSSIVYDIIVPIKIIENSKSESKFSTFSLTTNKIKTYKHSGMGSGVILAEMISKMGLDIQIPGINKYFSEILHTIAELQIKINWLSENPQPNLNKNETSIAIIRENINLDYISNFFKKTIDPNDPQNSIILTYFKNYENANIYPACFYLDSDLYMTLNESNILKNIIYDPSFPADNVHRRDREFNYEKQMKRQNMYINNNNLNKIDSQRLNSLKYLESISAHFSQHSRDDNKTIFDFLTKLKYPSIRNLIIDCFNPKKPLFHQSKQTTPVRITKNLQKEYVLKICIFKVFNLPNRQIINNQQEINDEDEGLIKMVSLRPFIHVNCQGQGKRTSTGVGNSPTWNEQMHFLIKFNHASSITLHLFDEVVENWLSDDRLEKSTIHCHYNNKWLASLKIPLINIFSQSKVEGLFSMYSPVEMLGYKPNSDEKHPTSHLSFDSSKKDASLRQKDDIFLGMYLEIFPKYTDLIEKKSFEKINSNEIDLTLQHLISFCDNYKNQFPDRKLYLLVSDSSGKHICFTRFFQTLKLFDFGECLRNMFPVTEQKDESVSSRGSTPHKRKNTKPMFDKEESDTNTVQSFFAADKRKFSKTKEMFESKNITEVFSEDGEFPVSIKMQIITRFVAMIPTYKMQSINDQFIVLSPYQTLKLSCGSMIDHTILLMGYFLQMGIECWCIAGTGIPRGFSTYVLIREDILTNEVMFKGLKSDRKSVFKSKDNWKYSIYDATSGIKYDTRSPFCPLQRVFFICNNENIWANIQNEDRCNLVKFNLLNSSDWRPVFQKGSIVSCPVSLPVVNLTNSEVSMYTYDVDNARQLRDTLEDKIKLKVQKWRGHRKTVWNRNCSKILREAVVQWEKWNLNTASLRPKHNSQLQQLLLSYHIYGFPLNLPYTTIDDIVSAVKGTQLYLNEHSSVEFALGVEIFPYPNFVYSVWIFFTSITKK